MGHNWVHFALPSAVAVITKKVLPDSSILKQLLLPHIRFTSRINHQGHYSNSKIALWRHHNGLDSRLLNTIKALFLPVASKNTNGFVDRYLRPWSSLPMTKEVFIENVGRKCAVYYGRRPEEFCPSSILLNENIKNLP